MPKTEVIVSHSNIVFDSIIKNSQYSADRYLLLNAQDIHAFVIKHSIIDTLLIEDAVDDVDALIDISNFIINFTNDTFVMPFRINDLLDAMEEYNNFHGIFCVIEKPWIYNQRLSAINNSDKGEVVRLTEKENQLLCTLLQSEDFEISKNDLLKQVWGYSDLSETNTVDTHISTLKNKLPRDALSYKNNIIKLNLGCKV